MNIAILTTGGTIEKTYDESHGTLANVGSVLQNILSRLRYRHLTIRHIPVMSKDSRAMTDRDRETILSAARAALPHHEALIIIHGTDTLTDTGHYLHAQMPDLERPIVLTGAMRPYEFRDTDAVQNVTEALLACRLLEPGVWVVMHNRALRFPGVVKDRAQMTFIRPGEPGEIGGPPATGPG